LAAFFINPPLAGLGGVVTPVEAMPDWLRHFAALNPIYHFGVISRAAMLKGAGMGTLWSHFLALGAIALTLLFFSVLRFRKQLA
jgi:ABC-2 type transport system permease protein